MSMAPARLCPILTPVLAIFASRYLNSRPPMIFEDGKQRRDFVHVYDGTGLLLCAGECIAFEHKYRKWNILFDFTGGSGVVEGSGKTI